MYPKISAVSSVSAIASVSAVYHVSLVVCSSRRPATLQSRDALDALAFGEVAAKVALKPVRRTEVSGGQLGKLQALLVQMSDDRAALASDAATLRDQVRTHAQAPTSDCTTRLV